MEAKKAKWVRKLNKNTVFKATEKRLENGMFFPCTIDGKLLSSGEETPMEPVEEIEEKSVEEEKTDTSMLQALIDRAKELGVKNPHKMKEETLVSRIAEIEAELE